MGVKINLSGSNISGNARVLNGLKVTGKNDAEINVTQSSMSGKSQILNNMNIHIAIIMLSICSLCMFWMYWISSISLFMFSSYLLDFY